MIYIALPVLNESEQITRFLDDLRNQSLQDFHLVVCVNQYDHWWHDEQYRMQSEDNRLTLEILRSEKKLSLDIIDKSSPGNGWPKKKGGVGWARKTVMDFIAGKALDKDVIVSMDADTHYPKHYLEAVTGYFETHPKKWGLALPYYHQVTGDDTHDRLMLRYELYMRNYMLNLLRIQNPYAFTALGSAMAFPVWAYLKVKGLTPVPSGEDFYFLQKLVKHGEIGLSVDTTAYPSARFSDRVLFGTGPALIRGSGGDWSAYPFYPEVLFNEIFNTFQQFPLLFEQNEDTPMDQFLLDQLQEEEPWKPLRKNYKRVEPFVRACQTKVDGLRILQYLRYRMPTQQVSEEEILVNLAKNFCSGEFSKDCTDELMEKGFWNTSVACLQQLRDALYQAESDLRKKVDGYRSP